MPKKLNVNVNTMDAVLEFDIETKASGKQLFDLVTRTLGIREVWYFGLMYTDVKGFNTWLRYDKKVTDQGVSKDSTVSFKLRAKFYPENVSQLVMEITLHFFYMQAKDDILCENIHCSPEASLLLASYALQAEYGPYEKDLHPPGLFADQKLLPESVVVQFDLTPEQWEGQIIDWWCKYGNMLRLEAELEYLKIAQDLDMYGVNYFDITNKKGTPLWLGVDAYGLNIYNKDDKLSPKISFPWGEIRNVEYHGKKFCIMPEDKNSPDFIFYAPKTKISDLIMQLCVGNHDLYLKRRKVDTMELQQMKAHAKDERARKMAERDKMEREKKMRLDLERQKMDLEEKLQMAQKQAKISYQRQLEAEKKAELYAERVKMAEEETRMLIMRKLETDEEMKKIKTIAMKSEEEKRAMQRKVNQVEEKAASLLVSSQQTKHERDELKRKLLKAESFDHHTPANHILVSSPSPCTSSSENLVEAVSITNTETTSPVDRVGSFGAMDNIVVSGGGLSIMNGSSVTKREEGSEDISTSSEIDADYIMRQLEKENRDYLEQKQLISQQLSALKNQMYDLRKDEGLNGASIGVREDESPTPEDTKLHVSLVRQTSHKHIVYNKSKAGSTKSRIEFFEEL